VKFWTAIIMQGRGDGDQWVKSIMISYTLNGKTWKWLNEGKNSKLIEIEIRKFELIFLSQYRLELLEFTLIVGRVIFPCDLMPFILI